LTEINFQAMYEQQQAQAAAALTAEQGNTIVTQ
jgi:preprotein translocase subunit SecB